MPRTILHADMDAFYAAVEQRDRPALRGKPVIIGGLGNRGVVSTASYEARVFGVKSAMPMVSARKLAPDAIYLTPRMSVYAGVSREIMDIFRSFTPLVEPLSLDEAFLDVTASERLFGDGPTIARAIRHQVRERTGLTVSIGVSANKYVAKVASDLDKPDGLVVVPPGTEIDFLAPLPVSCLWGAGRKAQERFRAHGMRTIGDVQQMGRDRLTAIFGKAGGAHFDHLSRGEDVRRVEPHTAAKSISHERTFETDLLDEQACLDVMLREAEGVGRRLRKAGITGRCVKLKLRYGNFETLSRQEMLPAGTSDDMLIYETAVRLFRGARDPKRGVRLLGVGVTDLKEATEGHQLDLFGDDPVRADRVNTTLDDIRDRFGEGSIGHGL